MRLFCLVSMRPYRAHKRAIQCTSAMYVRSVRSHHQLNMDEETTQCGCCCCRCHIWPAHHLSHARTCPPTPPPTTPLHHHLPLRWKRMAFNPWSDQFYFLFFDPCLFDTITQTQKDKINNNQKATMPVVSYQEARDAPTEPINTKGARAKSKRVNLTISFGEPFQRVINTSSVLFSNAVFLPNRGSSLSRNLSSAHTSTQGRQLWPF